MPMIGPITWSTLGPALCSVHCFSMEKPSVRSFQKFSHYEIHTVYIESTTEVCERSKVQTLNCRTWNANKVLVLSCGLVYNFGVHEMRRMEHSVESIWQIALCALQTYFKIFQNIWKRTTKEMRHGICSFGGPYLEKFKLKVQRNGREVQKAV